MTGFVKVDQNILDSSLWSEPSDDRIVWLTLLLLADSDGFVHAADPAIARRANVPLETTAAALERWQGPDQYSRTPDNEGRRIERIAGGYVILNYSIYRAKRDPEIRRQQVREAVAKHRGAKKATVSHGKPQKAQAEADREEEGEHGLTDTGTATRPGTKARRKARKHLPPESKKAVDEACDDWTEALGGAAPGGRIAGAWPTLLERAPWLEVRPIWRWYLQAGREAGRAEFCNPQDFANKLDYWRGRMNGSIQPRASPVTRVVESQCDAYDRAFELIAKRGDSGER